jgi:hypothetical protein
VPPATSPFRLLRSAPAIVFLLVLAVRGISWGMLESSPLSLWYLWMETDEHANVEWSARLAAGNWADIPAYRAYFFWQEGYGPPEAWERWYQKNAYYSGPLYPYGLAVLRRLFGAPFLPARFLHLLLAAAAAACLARAVQVVAEGFLMKPAETGGKHRRPDGDPSRAPFVAAMVAGLACGLYGPLVFHDFFLYRDGPVAHVSTILLAWPLIVRGRSDENGENLSKGEEGRAARGGWMRGASGAFLLGLLGGLAMLLKQTTAPLALASVYVLSREPLPSSPSKRTPGGRPRGRSLLFGLLGLAIPLGVLAARNVAAGVPPLTFDTRQAIGLAWGNGFGADATTAPPPDMKEILDEAGGSTLKTAWLVVEGYRDEPLELPKLFLKKLATFFNSFEVPDNGNFYFFRDRLPVLKVLPVFACLLGVGGVGLAVARGRRLLRGDEFLLAVTGILTPLAACLLVQTTSRYRVGVTGPLALGAGLFVVVVLDGVRRRRTRSVCLLLMAAAALSLVPLLPPVIYSARHRYSDTIVYATIVEGRRGPEAAAEEIRRYVEEAKDDRLYEAAVQVLRRWAKTGDRSGSLVEPEGIAPPERRLRDRD